MISNRVRRPEYEKSQMPPKSYSCFAYAASLDYGQEDTVRRERSSVNNELLWLTFWTCAHSCIWQINLISWFCILRVPQWAAAACMMTMTNEVHVVRQHSPFTIVYYP